MKYSALFFIVASLFVAHEANAMLSIINKNTDGTPQIDVQIKIKSEGECTLTYADQKTQKFEVDQGVEFCGYLNAGASVRVENFQKNNDTDTFPAPGRIKRATIKVNDRLFVVYGITRLCALEWQADKLKVMPQVFGNIEPEELKEVL